MNNKQKILKLSSPFSFGEKKLVSLKAGGVRFLGLTMIIVYALLTFLLIDKNKHSFNNKNYNIEKNAKFNADKTFGGNPVLFIRWIK